MVDLNPYVRYALKSTFYIHKPVYAYDCRFLYILDGDGMITVENRTFLLKKGTLCYYPAGKKYQIEGKNLEFFTLNFDFTCKNSDITTNISPVFSSMFDKNKVLSSFHEINEPLFEEAFCIKDASQLLPDLEAIVTEWENRLILNDEVTSAYLKLLICKILRLKNNAKPEETVFLKVLEYIKANYRNTIDNNSVANAINYHPNYINSVVKQKTGLSLHKFITAYRVNKATDLLCGTSLSVQEIAVRCGFVNANHFSVCFKKLTGVSPVNLRKGEK